jgi:hypothetical protein
MHPATHRIVIAVSCMYPMPDFGYIRSLLYGLDVSVVLLASSCDVVSRLLALFGILNGHCDDRRLKARLLFFRIVLYFASLGLMWNSESASR